MRDCGAAWQRGRFLHILRRPGITGTSSSVHHLVELETTCGVPGRSKTPIAGKPDVFFGLIILAFSLSRLWRRTFYPFFPSAVEDGRTPHYIYRSTA